MVMRFSVCVVDTNVVVSGLIGADASSPPARILDAMLAGRLIYLMSEPLLQEYSSVIRRHSLARLHGLKNKEIDVLLTDLVANAMWRAPVPTDDAPDAGDQHLWALLAAYPQSQLITGDQVLLRQPPAGISVISPRRFVDHAFPEPTADADS